MKPIIHFSDLNKDHGRNINPSAIKTIKNRKIRDFVSNTIVKHFSITEFRNKLIHTNYIKTSTILQFNCISTGSENRCMSPNFLFFIGWSKEELESINLSFNKFFKNGEYPSSNDMKEFIAETNSIRSVVQIRSKIQHLIGKKFK